MNWKKGDNIVTSDLAYPSNAYVWMSARKDGLELRRVKNVDGKVLLSDVEKMMDENTKMIVDSHTEYACGFTFNLDALTRLAHEHGALVVVDACQSLGAINLDVRKTGIDFMVTVSSKWLCGPSLSGIMYIREDLIKRFEPAYRFYANVDTFSKEYLKGGAPWLNPSHDNIRDYDTPLVNTAQKFDCGCVSDDELFGLHAALRYINNLGIKNIEKRVRKLSGYLIDGLSDIGCKVNTPLEPEERAGLVSYSAGSPEVDRKTVDFMNKVNINDSLRYQGGVGGIRVSTHFFNNEADIDKLLKVQKDVMK